MEAITAACADLLAWSDVHPLTFGLLEKTPFFVIYGRVETMEPNDEEGSAHERLALRRAIADATRDLQPIADRLLAAVPYLASPRCQLRVTHDYARSDDGPSLRLAIVVDDARAGVDRTEVSTVLGRVSATLTPFDRFLHLLTPYPAGDTLYTIDLRSVVADTPEHAMQLWWLIHRTQWLDGVPVPRGEAPQTVSVRMDLPFGADAAAQALGTHPR